MLEEVCGNLKSFSAQCPRDLGVDVFILMAGIMCIQRQKINVLEQQSPTFLVLGTSFVKDEFSTDWGGWVWFRR